MDGGDPRRLQPLGVSDAGKVQDLRRLDGPGAQQDLAVGQGRLHLAPLAEHVVDADGAPLLDANAGGAGPGLDGQVRALAHHRREIGLGRAPPATVADGHLIAAEALLLGPVEVVGQAMARLGTGLDDAAVEGMTLRPLPPADMQRALASMERGVPVLIAFGLAEIGQHVRIGPARQPHLPPLVIVPGMAADIDHAVDRRGAAQPLAPGPPQPAVVHVRLRLGPEAPVEVVLVLDQLPHAQRHAHQDGGVGTPGLQQQDLGVRVFGESGREHAAGASAADDHIVEMAGRHGRLRATYHC